MLAGSPEQADAMTISLKLSLIAFVASAMIISVGVI